MPTFEIRDQFYLDGKPFKIISGAIHYFRVPRPYWRDRLLKLKALGCNTVETYVAWNLHEPRPGEYDFSGGLDVAAFLRTAAELGLYAIVRPSPYICAEWEFGGLPAWLLAIPGIRLRCSCPAYLQAVARYYDALLPQLAPLQTSCGGPILLMQVENEYGAYGTDQDYLRFLAETMRRGGITVPFVTSDGPWRGYLHNGALDGALATANFGSKGDAQFDVLQAHHRAPAPLMCMEYWVGWFDAWGDEAHHTTDAAASAADLEAILRRGSVNIYMFCGGTNFGFMNGANYYDRLTPDVTSYDYDALLTEDGQITEKYRLFQQVIARYAPLPQVELPAIPRRAYGRAAVTASAALLPNVAALAQPTRSPYPLPMEQLGQGYGYILYRCAVDLDPAIPGAEKLRLTKTADRANIYLDNRHLVTLYDRELEQPHTPAQPIRGSQLDILVENLGRVNYGVRMEDQHKGIAGDVMLDDVRLCGFDHYPLPLDAAQLARIPFGPAQRHDGPAFYRVELEVDQPADTWLALPGWGKGCVAVNGVLLGRFWQAGPQRRLYLPAPFLHPGHNTLVIFETEGLATGEVEFFGAQEF